MLEVNTIFFKPVPQNLNYVMANFKILFTQKNQEKFNIQSLISEIQEFGMLNI